MALSSSEDTVVESCCCPLLGDGVYEDMQIVTLNQDEKESLPPSDSVVGS